MTKETNHATVPATCGGARACARVRRGSRLAAILLRKGSEREADGRYGGYPIEMLDPSYGPGNIEYVAAQVRHTRADLGDQTKRGTRTSAPTSCGRTATRPRA